MQSNRTTPSRVAGTGSALLLLLLGILLLAAALYLCFSVLRPEIESDLDTRVSDTLQDIGLSDENILVSGQDVMLAGTVPSDIIRQKAEVRAASIYGVARVYNNLRLAGESDTSNSTNNFNNPAAGNQSNNGQQTVPTGDASATANNTSAMQVTGTEPLNIATDGLVLDETLSPSTLDITVADGQATVQGIVPDETSIERILSAVQGKFGAANVEDDMSTYVGSAKPRWLDGTIKLIDQIDNIDNPFIKITHSGAVFGGTVDSVALGQLKTALARQLLGDYLDVKSEFSVADSAESAPSPEVPKRAVIKRPAILKIASDNGSPVIAGIVNSEREAIAIREGAANLFEGSFDDQLLVDDSVAQAPWLGEAIAIANNVRGVDNFSVSISNNQLLLSGDVTDSISARSLASAATDIAGNKFSVVNNFTPTLDGPIELSGEELLADELQRELNALDTAAIVFEKGSTTLTNDAKLVLNDVADVIMTYRNQVVEIAGHTDNTGDALTNLELSRKRAIAVQEYLVDRQVPQARLSPIGYGETDPIADNLTPQGQAANRRIEFKL